MMKPSRLDYCCRSTAAVEVVRSTKATGELTSDATQANPKEKSLTPKKKTKAQRVLLSRHKLL